MEEVSAPKPSKAAVIVGWIITLVPSAMLIMSAVMKFMKPQEVIDGFNHYGIAIGLLTGLGILELVCTIIYLVPRTAVLGAILLTGYLGGAILTGLRVGDAWIGPFVMGVAIWAGLWLREPRLRRLIPLQ